MRHVSLYVSQKLGWPLPYEISPCTPPQAYKNPLGEHLNPSDKGNEVDLGLKLTNMVVSEVDQPPGVLGLLS